MTLHRRTLDEVVLLLERMETLQSGKVLGLARRILPNLTADDLHSPHDFPELDDADWHFADGQLAGIQSALAAARALRAALAEEQGP
jgi:hypothetical protein